MPQNRTSGIKVLFLLSLILFSQGVNNYSILKNSTYYLGPDAVGYIMWAKNIHQDITATKLKPLPLIKTTYRYFSDSSPVSLRPPLYMFALSFTYAFSKDKNILAMTNMIFYLILIFSVYGIGKYIGDGKKGGILAVILISFFPAIGALSRLIIVDFALTAFTALIFYLMLRVFICNKLECLAFTIMAGITIGLASFVKSSFFIFLLPMFLYFILEERLPDKKQKMKYFFSAIALGLLISSVWYLNTLSLRGYAHFFNATSKTEPMFYLKELLKMLSPFIFIAFIFSLFFYIFSKKITFLLLVFLPLILFSLSPNRQDRFILPVLPFIAVIISDALWCYFKRHRYVLSIFVVMIIIQNITLSYFISIPSIRSFLLTKILLPDNLYRDHYNIDAGMYSRVELEDFENPCKKLLNIITDEAKNNNLKRKIDLLILTNKWRISSTIGYLIVRDNYNIREHYLQCDNDYFAFPISTDFDKQYKNWDIVIIPEGYPDDRMLIHHEKELLLIFNKHREEFILLDRIIFPDGIYCIYKYSKLSYDDHLWGWNYWK